MKTHPIITAAAVALGLALLSGEAGADEVRCAALAGQLRATAAGSPDAARRSVAALEKRAAAFGCASKSLAGRPRECAGISAELIRARRQLAAAGGDQRRKRIQAEYARLRCGRAPVEQREARAAPARSKGEPVRYVEQGGRVVALGPSGGQGPGGILSRLFGGSTLFGGDREAAPSRRQAAAIARLEPETKVARAAGSRQAAADGQRVYARGSFGGGSYRTLCVRTCDGYYFPISTVTTRSNFARDETVCRALCPNTEVALYAHPVGSESERMHAVADGMPYQALPTAFQYRKVVDPACTCAFEAKLVQTADGGTAIDVGASSDGSLLPDARATAADVTENGTEEVPPPSTASAAAPSPAPAAAAPAIPAVGVLPSGDLVHPAAVVPEPAPMAAATGTVEPAVAAASGAPPASDTASDMPRGEPPASRPPLRVRTIGPAFLQNQ